MQECSAQVSPPLNCTHVPPPPLCLSMSAHQSCVDSRLPTTRTLAHPGGRYRWPQRRWLADPMRQVRPSRNTATCPVMSTSKKKHTCTSKRCTGQSMWQSMHCYNNGAARAMLPKGRQHGRRVEVHRTRQHHESTVVQLYVVVPAEHRLNSAPDSAGRDTTART